jgi:hypothetical protein
MAAIPAGGAGGAGAPAAAPAAGAPFTAGIFFDNEQRRIDQVTAYCPRIEGIKIPVGGDPVLVDIGAQAPEIESSDYVAIIRNIAGEEGKDMFDAASGIDETHVDRLHAWYAANRDQRCVAIFDWDRTITKIEGAFLNKNYASIATSTFAESLTAMSTHVGRGPLTPAKDCRNPNAIAVGAAVKASESAKGASAADAAAAGDLARVVDQTLQYLCGGNDRLEMLKNDVFGYCVRNGITVCILTNSSGCGQPGPGGFKYSRCFRDLITGLFPVEYRDTPFIIRCSDPPPPPDPKNAPTHKGKTLRADPLFGLVCAAIGGTRRKRYRRRRSHRRSRK